APRTPRPLSAPVGQRLLRGAPGAVVTLTVLRAGESDPLELSIVRERLTPVPPKGKMLEGGTTGYLKVAEIRAHSADDVRSELEALRKAGARDLVLDLRGGAEGSVPHAPHAAGRGGGHGPAPGGVRSRRGGGVTKIRGAHPAEEVLSADPARSFWDLPMAT